MITSTQEYKGNKILVIKNDEGDKYPFQFGLGKAKKILAAIEDIKKFVAENDKPAEAEKKEDF